MRLESLPLPKFRDKEVTSDNFERCVKLSNLPWTINIQRIINFFVGYNLLEENIFIQERNGKKTGYAICVLESKEEAQRAIRELHKKEIKAPTNYYQYQTLLQSQKQEHIDLCS
jgi:RNA recognition motif-containing protein